MTKVLVTGGAGFIGSHTVDLLIEKGYNVVIIDNLSTGKKENLNPKATFYEKDIRDKKKIDQIFDKEKPESIIHLAAQTNARASLSDPINDEDININGSIVILEACRKHKVKKIVYSSSAAVYGDPEYLPIDERHPIKPINQYGVSKYAVELLLHVYHSLYGIKYTVLRYANVYGPRQDPYGEAGVVAIFTKKIKNNEEITIKGDGKQTRDFIYVKDVVRANLLALKSYTEDETFNISTGKKISLLELADMIQKAYDKKLDIEHVDETEGEIKDSCLDNQAAIKYLGFDLKYSLEEGLKEE